MCALQFADPRPSPSELERLYAGGYFDSKGWLDPTSDAGYMSRCWNEISPLLARRFPSGGRLLDVGCATGAFIAAAAAAGWTVAGLEFSPVAAQRARDAGFDVRSGELAEGAFAGETFDVITAWHVVEHLVDPVADLRHMRTLIARDGLLVVETPNARSIGALVRRARWAQIRPPEHINFFDGRALERTLDASGWRLRREWTIYKRDTAERIAGRRGLVRLARAAAFGSELMGMGGNLRAIAEAA